MLSSGPWWTGLQRKTLDPFSLHRLCRRANLCPLHSQLRCVPCSPARSSYKEFYSAYLSPRVNDRLQCSVLVHQMQLIHCWYFPQKSDAAWDSSRSPHGDPISRHPHDLLKLLSWFLANLSDQAPANSNSSRYRRKYPIRVGKSFHRSQRASRHIEIENETIRNNMNTPTRTSRSNIHLILKILSSHLVPNLHGAQWWPCILVPNSVTSHTSAVSPSSTVHI